MTFPERIAFAVAARPKARAGRAALAGDVRDANPTTGARLLRLAVNESFLANDFVLYLLMDKATGECERWAYAEKGEGGRDLVFAFGRGTLKTGMAITDCAVVAVDGFDALRYDHGGEMEDTGQEVRLARRLDDLAFASRISELSEDAGARRRTQFAGALKQLAGDDGPRADRCGGEGGGSPPSAAAPATPGRRRSAARPPDDEDDEKDTDG